MWESFALTPTMVVACARTGTLSSCRSGDALHDLPARDDQAAQSMSPTDDARQHVVLFAIGPWARETEEQIPKRASTR